MTENTVGCNNTSNNVDKMHGSILFGMDNKDI